MEARTRVGNLRFRDGQWVLWVRGKEPVALVAGADNVDVALMTLLNDGWTVVGHTPNTILVSKLWLAETARLVVSKGSIQMWPNKYQEGLDFSGLTALQVCALLGAKGWHPQSDPFNPAPEAADIELGLYRFV